MQLVSYAYELMKYKQSTYTNAWRMYMAARPSMSARLENGFVACKVVTEM